MKLSLPDLRKIIILTSIVIIATLLRGQETYSHNFLFLIDQGRDMLAVKNIIADHHLTLIGPYTSLGGVFQGPIWYYFLSIPTLMFRGDPWGAVLFMCILSILVVCTSIFCIRRFLGIQSAIFVGIYYAVSPEAVAAATFSWNPHPMWMIILLYSFFLYIARYKNVYAWFVVWPLITLSFHFQTAMGVILTTSTMLQYIAFWSKRKMYRHFMFGFLISLILLFPQVLFDFRHNFLMSRSIIKIFQGSNQGLFVGGENHGLYSLIQAHIYELLVHIRSAFPQDGFSPIVCFLILFGVIYIHVSHSSNKIEKQFIRLCLEIIATVYIVAILYPFPLRSWFLTGFQTLYLLIAGVTTGVLWRNRLGKVIILISITLLLYSAIIRINLLYVHPPNDGGVAKIKGKLAAIDWIYHNANGNRFGLYVFTPPVNTDAYDYLVWYRSKKYSYLPYREKRGIVYLLIEPDPSKPWSYNGWLETVIQDGEILQTIDLPSGFIIQKRRFAI